jgi:hypothetical protein
VAAARVRAALSTVVGRTSGQQERQPDGFLVGQALGEPGDHGDAGAADPGQQRQALGAARDHGLSPAQTGQPGVNPAVPAVPPLSVVHILTVPTTSTSSTSSNGVRELFLRLGFPAAQALAQEKEQPVEGQEDGGGGRPARAWCGRCVPAEAR